MTFVKPSLFATHLTPVGFPPSLLFYLHLLVCFFSAIFLIPPILLFFFRKLLLECVCVCECVTLAINIRSVAFVFRYRIFSLFLSLLSFYGFWFNLNVGFSLCSCEFWKQKTLRLKFYWNCNENVNRWTILFKMVKSLSLPNVYFSPCCKGVDFY